MLDKPKGGGSAFLFAMDSGEFDQRSLPLNKKQADNYFISRKNQQKLGNLCCKLGCHEDSDLRPQTSDTENSDLKNSDPENSDLETQTRKTQTAKTQTPWKSKR